MKLFTFEGLCLLPSCTLQGEASASPTCLLWVFTHKHLTAVITHKQDAPFTAVKAASKVDNEGHFEKILYHFRKERTRTSYECHLYAGNHGFPFVSVHWSTSVQLPFYKDQERNHKALQPVSLRNSLRSVLFWCDLSQRFRVRNHKALQPISLKKFVQKRKGENSSDNIPNL